MTPARMHSRPELVARVYLPPRSSSSSCDIGRLEQRRADFRSVTARQRGTELTLNKSNSCKKVPLLPALLCR
jgi:hypothetical protein